MFLPLPGGEGRGEGGRDRADAAKLQPRNSHLVTNRQAAPPSNSASSFVIRHSSFPLRRAFTLIELLVVIAIIGILASLLLPALANGKKRVRRAACLNNLRQTHLAFLAYAHDFDGAVPIGYRSGRKQFNTMIYSGTANYFVTFGRLYVAKLMEEPRIFYCPAETATSQSYNSVDNPWPPGISGANVQGGYASTPVTDWAASEFPATLPRLDDLVRQALFADGAGLPDRVNSRHVEGVNVLFTDGGAQWVARSWFDLPLSQCTSINPAFNPQQDAIWSVFNQR